MAKRSIQFVCRHCGSIQSRWYGKCPACGQWDGLEETTVDRGAAKDHQKGVAQQANAVPAAVAITDVGEAEHERVGTGIGELDRVLGFSGGRAGLVPGATMLLGGDPGIGKSTLLLQAGCKMAESNRCVLYVSAEESAQQIRLRADRLGALAEDLYVLADTNLARIVEQARQVQPDVLIVDSIQMIYKGDVDAAPGAVTQLRACCTELVYLAKSTGMAIFLVGHVTKEGRLAGPRMIEHLVDCVLYFEGDRYHSHRLVRSIKNRFGATQEVGLFEMTERGLVEVSDPSGILAAEYAGDRHRAGSVVCATLQGSRCLLVEVQALTADGFLGAAKRKTSGLDNSRLAMLVAVLEKRGELRLADQDIFISAVGGLKITEPGADLAIAMAIAGSFVNRQLQADTCVIGEVGLGGELRSVQQTETRLKEAARLGFTQVICPPLPSSVRVPEDCQVLPVRHIQQALELLG